MAGWFSLRSVAQTAVYRSDAWVCMRRCCSTVCLAMIILDSVLWAQDKQFLEDWARGANSPGSALTLKETGRKSVDGRTVVVSYRLFASGLPKNQHPRIRSTFGSSRVVQSRSAWHSRPTTGHFGRLLLRYLFRLNRCLVNADCRLKWPLQTMQALSFTVRDFSPARRLWSNSLADSKVASSKRVRRRLAHIPQRFFRPSKGKKPGRQAWPLPALSATLRFNFLGVKAATESSRPAGGLLTVSPCPNHVLPFR